MLLKRNTLRIAALLCCLVAGSIGQGFAQKVPDFNRFINSQHNWVDSVFQTMSMDEKIGQLIVAAAYTNRGKAHADSIQMLIKDYKIGGLIYFQGGPVRQARLTNQYQKAAKVPLMIAMDLEWGLGMRLDSTINFPYQMALGAITNDKLVEDMGVAIAEQCRRLGIHINFAPVVDVNNNAANPVINYRSFGEDKDNVGRKGIAYMKGMQKTGILATAKHFPGHGDTDTDSHYALPVVQHTRERLDSLELAPFRDMIAAGTGGMMVAHMSIPSLDNTKNLPSTLSKPIVTDLLKNEMGFEGLTFTDAMNMKGVTKFHEPGKADAMALLAGNDVLEFTPDIPKAVKEIKALIDRGELTEAEITKRCKKVLAAKLWFGLDKPADIKAENIIAELNSKEHKALNRKLIAASLTVIQEEQVLPIKQLKGKKFAVVSVGKGDPTAFQKRVKSYVDAAVYNLPNKASNDMISLIEKQLADYDEVIIAVHQQTRRPSNNKVLTKELISFVDRLAARGNATVAYLRNPYTLSQFQNIHTAKAIVLGYADDDDVQDLSAQLIFGALNASGKLPISVNEHFKAGDGIPINALGRLKYVLPIDVGMNVEKLGDIDSLVAEAIREKAIPGAQVLVAKNEQVVYHKAFGYHTFDSTSAVELDDLYDLASVTKISASLLGIMKLYEEGKIDLDAPLSTYVPELRRSNKADLTMREMLTHQARLKAWIPFWQDTKRKSGKFKWYTFKEDSSRRFPYKVADNLYLHRNYANKVFKAIRKAPQGDSTAYVYSDLSFYLYPRIITELSGQDFEKYLKENFYEPMGANTLTYNPLRFHSLEDIVPTEYDSLFRKTLIHGRVHDEGAAMLDGVSGHAGLFGNSADLAKLLQMYLNFGTYGGERYLEKSTFDEFTRCQFCDEGNRRALGFDRPNMVYKEPSNAAESVSQSSFGHTGFTGIFTWMDPEHELLYIFLSNRVYPTRENTKLYKLNTRTKIQQVLYDALEKEQIKAKLH